MLTGPAAIAAQQNREAREKKGKIKDILNQIAQKCHKRGKAGVECSLAKSELNYYAKEIMEIKI